MPWVFSRQAGKNPRWGARDGGKNKNNEMVNVIKFKQINYFKNHVT